MSPAERIAERLATGELTITRLVDGSGVILDVDGLAVFSVNETGMFLVERLKEGVTDPDELSRMVAADFEVEPEQAADDVEAFLTELARRVG